MRKLKVITILGTRPEIIRLSEVIKKCDKYFNHILVHTGQNWDYTLNEIFFKELEIRDPDYFLDVVGNNIGETIGNIIDRSYKMLVKESPDAVLILGDTNSCLSAISAKRLKIPIFHMEAGNRCFDENVPEEINRKIVDHISDINLPYTDYSRKYLLAEGIRKEHILVVGSPMQEVLQRNIQKINASTILEDLSLERRRYFIVSLHREENVNNEKKINVIFKTINTIARTYRIPIIFSAHPRTMKIINEGKFKFDSLVKILKPLGYLDYNKLQKNSFCVLSDSGTLAEESSILNFRGVLIRDNTERPEVLEKGSMIIGGTSQSQIENSINIITSMKSNQISNIVYDYKEKCVSDKIIKIIQSYTNIIDLTVWKK